MANFTELFYGALPLLHALGAILALSLSFACDTGRAVQSARVPYRLPLPTVNFSFSSDRAFLAAYPWDEGGEFVTHQWNPFALIFVFEWLTAGFAARPLMYFTERTGLLMQVWLAWLATGVVVFLAWTLSNSGGVCVAMLCTVLASFVLSMVVAYLTLVEDPQDVDVKARLSRPNKGGYQVLQGRVWWVPQSVTGLRHRGGALGGMEAAGEVEELDTVDVEQENTLGVLVRYAEYCITAPLLFLAVVCLMVVDAPAWLFLTGYWLLVTCNAVGCALHACFVSHEEDHRLRESGGWAGFIVRLFFANPWCVCDDCFSFYSYRSMTSPTPQERPRGQPELLAPGGLGVLARAHVRAHLPDAGHTARLQHARPGASAHMEPAAHVQPVRDRAHRCVRDGARPNAARVVPGHPEPPGQVPAAPDHPVRLHHPTRHHQVLLQPVARPA